MRYCEFKLVENKLFESNRGIIGTVIDTQAGSGSATIFNNKDGEEVRATNAWKFPSDETTLRYQSTNLSSNYINRLQIEFSNAKLSNDLQNKIDKIINQNSIVNLQLIASSNINILSDKAKQHLKNQNHPTEHVPVDQQFADELKNNTGMNIDTVKWVGGQKLANGFSALVVELTSDKGRMWVGKYFKSKQTAGHIFWQVTKFLEDINSIGIKLQSKQGAKSKGTSGAINLGPKEIGITDKVVNMNNLVTEIANGVEANEKIPNEEKITIVNLVKNLGGDTVNINPEYTANYEVQLGEVVAPLAISKGINVSGAIPAAEEKLLDLLDPGVKFTDIQQVEYPSNIAEKLVDSYLITPNGSRVGISSKDKKGGAAASFSSIIETINNKIEIIKEIVPDFEERYAEYIKRSRVIENSSGKSVAFNLGVEMGIINKNTAKEALDLMLKNPGNEQALKEIDNGRYYDLTINYKGYAPKLGHPMYKISYHAVSSLARMVAAEFNKDKKQTNKFFGTVLESSNMIQVLTTLKAKGDQAAFTDFNVIYPPVFDGDIKLEPGSYFTATKVPAGFTFKIPTK